MNSAQVTEEPFPAQSKRATGPIDGVATEASSLFFSDKILVTLSQEGRLSQWIQVPLSAPSPAAVDMALANASLLPMSHLTPKTLLGGGGEERESLAQLYAVQIASHIARANSEERRTLVVGLGLQRLRPEREAFFDVLELIQKVL
ncbi:Uu.00g094270.m01.CDS01 [Anthostomella pinea]|uniref:Uu.00g094270.m01.CDS01 n=1 Tax=Anthostomella pinea TaxID=933095 RepID=A0AAI8VNL3_9PEZI|nr:Uu.00g094270.m01.CDS01 [Anthostomella pinea]